MVIIKCRLEYLIVEMIGNEKKNQVLRI